MDISNLYMKSPCGQCPFRKDCLKGWLGAERAEEIANETSFVCHKDHSRQCSGSMQLNPMNTFAQIGERMGLVELKGREKIFDTKQDMINHHKK